ERWLVEAFHQPLTVKVWLIVRAFLCATALSLFPFCNTEAANGQATKAQQRLHLTDQGCNEPATSRQRAHIENATKTHPNGGISTERVVRKGLLDVVVQRALDEERQGG